MLQTGNTAHGFPSENLHANVSTPYVYVSFYNYVQPARSFKQKSCRARPLKNKFSTETVICQKFLYRCTVQNYICGRIYQGFIVTTNYYTVSLSLHRAFRTAI